MLKVSIIVPAYNSQDYIEECLDSLINQTYKNIEIIIIDDKSSDKTAEIMRKYEKLDKRIKCIYSNYNNGANLSRTIGIKECTGDYIMFVDSDDYIKTETIQELIEIINNKNVDIIKFCYINKKNSICSVFFKKENNKNELYKELLSNDTLNNLSNEIVIKNLFNTSKDVFNIKSSSGEDLLMNLELFDKAEKILVIPNKYYYYRENNNSTTQTDELNRIYNNINEIQYTYDLLCNYAIKWNLLTKDIGNKIAIKETIGILNNVMRILNSKQFRKGDIVKLNNILKNNQVLKIISKDDIRKINTNIVNKRIYLCIYNKKLEQARIWLKIKKMIKTIMGAK